MGGQGKVERMRERERDSDSYFPPLARVTCARTIGACTVVRTPSARWQQLLSERMSFFFFFVCSWRAATPYRVGYGGRILGV